MSIQTASWQESYTLLWLSNNFRLRIVWGYVSARAAASKFNLNIMLKAQMLIVNHCFGHFLAPTVLTMSISIERYVIATTRINTEAENSPQVI